MPGVRLVSARLPCRLYVAARIDFQTISGDILCSVEKRLPYCFSYSEMRALLEFDGFFEVLGENFEPLDLDRGLHFQKQRPVELERVALAKTAVVYKCLQNQGN